MSRALCSVCLSLLQPRRTEHLPGDSVMPGAGDTARRASLPPSRSFRSTAASYFSTSSSVLCHRRGTHEIRRFLVPSGPAAKLSATETDEKGDLGKLGGPVGPRPLRRQGKHLVSPLWLCLGLRPFRKVVCEKNLQTMANLYVTLTYGSREFLSSLEPLGRYSYVSWPLRGLWNILSTLNLTAASQCWVTEILIKQ